MGDWRRKICQDYEHRVGELESDKKLTFEKESLLCWVKGMTERVKEKERGLGHALGLFGWGKTIQ